MSFCKDVVKSFLQLVEKVIKEDVKKNKFIHFDIRPDDFLKIFKQNNIIIKSENKEEKEEEEKEEDQEEKEKKEKKETKEVKVDKVEKEQKEAKETKEEKEMKEIEVKIMKEESHKFINIFDNNEFYTMILNELYKINLRSHIVEFNSFYSFLYFIRTINYINLIIKSDNDFKIIEDIQFKVYLYLLILMIQEDSTFEKKLGINEALFVGTFEELKKKYSNCKYYDSIEITDIITKWKENSNVLLNLLIQDIFQKIVSVIIENGDLNDKVISKMYKDAKNILYKSEKIIKTNKKYKIEEILIREIKQFYSNIEYVIFINYYSEKNQEGETITKINSNFLQNENNKKYQKYDIEINDLKNNKDDVNSYLSIKYKYLEKIELLLPKIFIEIGVEDEILISSLLGTNYDKYQLYRYYDTYKTIKNNSENLNNENIESEIKAILENDEIYQSFFSILQSSLIINFFNERISVNENKDEFEFIAQKEKDSECFKTILKNFIKNYDKRNNNYNEFKNLIILKILPKGDRAYVINKFKNYIINPSQFLIGNQIKEENNKNEVIKTILKGYLLIILLYETEHFLSLFHDNKDSFNKTLKEKEGGELFIKYIFGVKVISRINYDQAKAILNLENWKEKENIRKIFKEQSKGFVDDEYLPHKYPDSISFYSTKETNNISFGNKNSYALLWK